jgi:hypothetical protein
MSLTTAVLETREFRLSFLTISQEGERTSARTISRTTFSRTAVSSNAWGSGSAYRCRPNIVTVSSVPF